MERKEQSALKQFKDFYIENFLVPVKTQTNHKPQTSIEDVLIRIIKNLINCYKGCKHLKKIDSDNEDYYSYIIESIYPILKMLRASTRNKIYNLVKFSGKSKQETIKLLKGYAGSINLGLQYIIPLYQDTDDVKTTKLLNKIDDKFSTPHKLIEKLK